MIMIGIVRDYRKTNEDNLTIEESKFFIGDLMTL